MVQISGSIQCGFINGVIVSNTNVNRGRISLKHIDQRCHSFLSLTVSLFLFPCYFYLLPKRDDHSDRQSDITGRFVWYCIASLFHIIALSKCGDGQFYGSKKQTPARQILGKPLSEGRLSSHPLTWRRRVLWAVLQPDTSGRVSEQGCRNVFFTFFIINMSSLI